MANQKLQAIILAAGESSRFWPLNSKNKCLIKIMGKPLIWYTINGLIEAGIDDLAIVQNSDCGIKEALKDFNFEAKIEYATQDKPLGMGNAIICAQKLIKNKFFVLNAERVNCGNIVKSMVDCLQKTGAKVVLAGEETKTPWLYGIARLEGDKVLEVVEKPAEGKEPSNINVTGIRLCDMEILNYLKAVAGKTSNNDEFEMAISLFIKENDCRIVIFNEGNNSVSLKYPWYLLKTRNYLFDKFLTKKQIAKSAQIAKNAVVEGNVYIGENAKIYEGAVIKGPCYIGDNSVIGNNSIVRDYCDLEAGAMVGALCEVGRTIFQPDVHVHSGYFGDSILAGKVRCGAGVITANKRNDRGQISVRVKKEKDGVKVLSKVDTGLDSLGAIIGADSRIGVNSSIMPGCFIGKNSQIGPNSVVMRNVDDCAKI